MGDDASLKLDKAIVSLNLDRKDSFNIHLVVNELVSNALDHGLLLLSSAEKSQPSGFDAYYRMRSERIKQGNTGHIEIHISREFSAERHKLHIHVADTGDGFDTDSLDAKLPGSDCTFGRGISIVRQLCSSVSYSPKGNQVHVTYDLEG
ncbi:MAG: ATP-binding protein [Methylophaga sp.]|nr:ATP-binding protein [Methylophaga sp.]